MKLDSVRAWLELQDEEFYANVSESISRDRGDQQKSGNTEPLDKREGGNQPEEDQKEDAEDPYSTKGELYKYFAGKGPTEMISSFLHDERNYGYAVILCDLSQPLEDEYASNQDTISSGPDEALLWAGKRASGSWFQMVVDIAAILQSLKFARHLRLTFSSGSPLVDIPAWLQVEFKLLGAAWDFGCHLISAILWANLLHSYRLPHAAAVYLLPEGEKRDIAVERVKEMVRCLLKDIGWNFHQLPREIMAFLVQDLDEELLMLFHKLYYGPSTTKEICESTFSWLHYKVQSTTRNSVMNDWTKYTYCILSPYTAASGMNQLLPDEDDWFIVNSPAGKQLRSTAAKFMTIQSTEMPEDVPGLDVNSMDKTWRKAGVLSDERSIAAMAYLLEEEKNDWSNMSAVKAKVFLLAENLKSITAKLRLDVPRFPNGSGVKGSVIKEDHARALVRFLFAEESVEKQEELVKSLAPPVKTKKTKPDEAVDEESKVLGMIAQLDPENAQAFQKMSMLAKEKLAEMYRAEGAEELKKNVREALGKEDMDIEFKNKGEIQVKRRKVQDPGNEEKSAEIGETW
eukprot:s11_g67.t1